MKLIRVYIVLCVLAICFASVLVIAQSEQKVETVKGRVVVTPLGTLPNSTHLIGTVVDDRTTAGCDEGDTIIYFDSPAVIKLTINETIFHSLVESEIILVIFQ